jgi:hypothetical protein
VYVLEPDHFIPDVSVLRHASPAPGTVASVAVLDPPIVSADAPLRLRAAREPMREAFIDIVGARQPGQVITAIELLSLANKAVGRGREDYRRKQQQVLESDTHFLEIDLLRGGAHTVAAPANLPPTAPPRGTTSPVCTAPGRFMSTTYGRARCVNGSRASSCPLPNAIPTLRSTCKPPLTAPTTKARSRAP